MKYFVKVNGHDHEVVLTERLGELLVEVDGEPMDIVYEEVDSLGQVLAITGEGAAFGVSIEGDSQRAGITIAGHFYDIEIEDFIGTFSGQEAMDACYVLADPNACAGIVRINGSLATSGAGLPGYNTNLSFRRAEGIEISANTGYDMGSWGNLEFDVNANYYLTNELQSAPFSSVVDCNGYYGTTCDPVPQLRVVQRTTWQLGDVELSYLWRHLSGMDAQTGEAAGLFPAFRSIDAYNYFDLTGAYTLNDNVRFTATVDNIFDEDPPIIGNSTGTTAFNSGNTYPSLYDVLGRVYTVGVTVNF